MDRTALADNHLRTLDALGVTDYQLLLQQITDESLEAIVAEALTGIRYNGETIRLLHRLYTIDGVDEIADLRRVKGKLHGLSAGLRRLMSFVRIEQANRRLIVTAYLPSELVALTEGA